MIIGQFAVEELTEPTAFKQLPRVDGSGTVVAGLAHHVAKARFLLDGLQPVCLLEAEARWNSAVDMQAMFHAHMFVMHGCRREQCNRVQLLFFAEEFLER